MAKSSNPVTKFGKNAEQLPDAFSTIYAMMVEVCVQDIYTKKRIAQKKAGDAGVRKVEKL